MKADLFNDYFASLCTINDSGSFLPEFVSRTGAVLDHITVNINEIINIINSFNPKKAHGYDGISIAMIRLCAAEVAVSLLLMIAWLMMYSLIVGTLQMYNPFTKRMTVRY